MKKILFSIGVAVIIVAGCSSVKTTYLSNYSAQISFFDYSAEYYAADQMMKCKLSDTASLNGYKCISWIWFFKNGQIKQFETAIAIKMPGYTIPSNSTIFFNEENPAKIKHVWFSGDVKINHVECKGGGKISTEFYDNDSLKACFLVKDQEIQGFPCESSLFEPIYFYPDGKIKILTLSADFNIADAEYKKGESILIKEDGMVTRFTR